MKRLSFLLAAVAAFVPAFAQMPSGDELLEKMERSGTFKTFVYQATIEITMSGDTRVKAFDAWSVGETKAFVSFTNPEDSGVKYLKLGKELWIYFPEEQDTVKISGHLLKEGMMGSDVSYEDALESATLSDKYSAQTTGEEDIDGRKTWIVSLKAKNKTAQYDGRKIWVDAERFIGLKEEMYAKSGMLMKTSRTEAVKQAGDKWIGTRVVMENKIRKDTKTVFTIGKFTVNQPVDERKFTLKELSK